jgi:pimeloyl-ACP methyl ester carboxylesterase
MPPGPFRRRDADAAPEPPVALPPGRTVLLPGRGEVFVRDTGGDGPPVLLLHGWMFAADLNWWPVYDALRDAGHRVLAIDHRGHGRGLRSPQHFTLERCAADAAGLVAQLGCGPVVAAGYSMGGPIAQLMARDHAEHVRGLVLCATAQDWSDPHMKAFWRTMAGLRLTLNAFPLAAWTALLRTAGLPPSPQRTWTAAELSRGSSRDIAEAGRELSRYDARPWLSGLDLPAAVVLTSRDRSVPPHKQRALAVALRASVHEVPADHMAVVTDRDRFRAALLAALEAVGGATHTSPRDSARI